MKNIANAIALLIAVLTLPVAAEEIYRGHALAMHGDVKYGADFTHFDYVNPKAPKGGELVMASIGTFDSLNGFIIKGNTAAALGLIYNSLTSRSYDEPFTLYGELAETIEMPQDRSWVSFTLRQGARWHDGKPIIVEDVIFSFDILKTEGHPFFRNYWADVEKAEKTGERTVKFTFGGEINLELPLIIGELTILPKHYWEGREFAETTLEPPLGSGPYKIESVDAGRSITYQRVEDYWGQDLPVHKGRYNFDRIRYDYYRDATVAVEALKAGEFYLRVENTSKIWATGYDVEAVEKGHLIKELVPHQNGTGMQGFAFNTRRSKFSDPKVRQALAYAFDFEWTNTNLFYGQYTRTKSYYSNTELASSGLPSGGELEILEPYHGRIPDEVFTQTYEPPSTDGSGKNRQNLRTARKMLEEAGWKVVDNALTHTASGEVMNIEFLMRSPAFERIVGPLQKSLERLGIESNIRMVDGSQYQNRLQEYDFDVTVVSLGQSQSPGNEQRIYWGSDAADTPGTRNYSGIKDPVVDELIESLIAAPSRQSLVDHTRALDRVLLWGHYVIPNWHIRSHRVVYWNKFGKPDTPPKYVGRGSLHLDWWYDAERAKAVMSP